MHRAIEAWTMARVDGLIAVSQAYHETLRGRYPWIAEDTCDTITFGASEEDYAASARSGAANRYFTAGDGYVHGVYAGVLGRVMRDTCEALCLAFAHGLAKRPDLFSRLRLHFVGTDYQRGSRAVPTIRPIAEAMGLGRFIHEDPQRIPYLRVLAMLREADFLLIPASRNRAYSPSKLYAYILARRPLLVLCHERSGVVDAVRTTHAGEIVTFGDRDTVGDIAARALPQWIDVLERLPFVPATDWRAFETYTARATTERQCRLFDRALARGRLDSISTPRASAVAEAARE